MRTEAPRDLKYSKEDNEKYRKLLQDDLSPFAGAMYKDIFLYAVAYGFNKGLRKQIKKPQPNIPLAAFSEDEVWILKSTAIAEKQSLEILNDEKQLYQIVEEYANGAIEEIYLEIFGGKPGEPNKRMTNDILKEIDRLNLDNSTQ